MKPIIHCKELATLHSEHLIIIDASNGKDAYTNYKQKHLKGALFVDLNMQLANIQPDVAIGGRHPLPSLEQFSKTLTELGITNESHVVVYDDKQGANAAARFWWMLKAVGHQKVQVLNGGFQAAIHLGFPADDMVVKPKGVAPYLVSSWQLPLATIQEVEDEIASCGSIVIDVREAQRYQGIIEPIDLVAGHIPGAINVPFTTNLDVNGQFLPLDVLTSHFTSILKNTPASDVIVHCGSGVTACHTLLAMSYAGFQLPKLYVGSWSEWSRSGKSIVALKNDDKPVNKT
uniref:sulfurtransferase n=1 Tax=Gelidibacter sp. TaxID=2018083 RepID=UPI00404B058F